MWSTVLEFLLGLLSPFKGLKSWWNNLSEDHKNYVVLAISTLTVLLILSLITAWEKHEIKVAIKAAYEQGYKDGITKDQKDRQEELAKLEQRANSKVKAVQDTADASAKDALTTISDLHARLHDSDARLKSLQAKLNTAVYDAQGNTLLCYKYKKGAGTPTQDTPQETTPETEIHLGSDFSDEWNRLNDTVNQTIAK